MSIKVSILGSEFVLELPYQFLHLKQTSIGYDIRYDIVYDIGYDIVNYLLNVLIFDLTIFIQVLRPCSTYSTFHGFGVAVWVRDISSIQLTVRICAHGALVDITQQCSSHLRAIHDKCMKKCADAAHSIICKSKISIGD